MKLLKESRKILNDPSLRFTATCVRVPVLRCHAEALNVQFTKAMSVERAL